ncbi:MAG: hypothetical protein QNL12_08925 [Acidimicrobiia bacterium]|nr:hypothetical protein [Acidimicrobiia bacterium]
MAWLKHSWVRRPLWFVAGLGAAAVAGLAFQPQWLDLCNRINSRPHVGMSGQIVRGDECSPVSPMTMSGNFLIGFGLFMLVIGPIIFSLAHVIRNGYNWESTRVETAVTNLPMLAGVLYMATGMGLAIMGTA